MIAFALMTACAAMIVSARDWDDMPWLPQPEPLTGAGQMITLRTAYHTTFDAYLVGPEDASEGVLLVHDRWGLNERVVAWTDRLAEQGFRVLCVDLYDGRQVQRVGMEDLIWSQIDPVWIDADLNRGLQFLVDAQERVAVSAWGGSIAAGVDLALRHPDQVSALMLYPVPATTDLTKGLPWMPIPVLKHPIPRSPFHLRPDDDSGRIADAALEATRAFLKERDSARRP